MGRPSYIEVHAKSVLNRVQGMPFRWSINPYRGCRHGCPFCYARRTHWFLDEDGIDGWTSRIFVKVNAPEVLRAELSRPGWAREEVAVGTATDPYQPIEGTYRLTRRILVALHDYRTPASIVTRSPLVQRDVDVLSALASRAGVTVCVSIATLDASLARRLEPTVAPPASRLRTVWTLARHGIRTGILLAPILPGLTDAPSNLESVVAAARDHGACFLWSTVLHLGPVTREAFFRFLEDYHPDLLPAYRDLYASKYAPPPYRAAVARTVERLKATYGLQADRAQDPQAPEQLPLLTAS
jgi:DNA repair photolyase